MNGLTDLPNGGIQFRGKQGLISLALKLPLDYESGFSWPLWEKRLSKLKSSRGRKPISPESYVSDSEIGKIPASRRVKNRKFNNRSTSLDRIRITSFNTSEEFTSSFEHDSPLIGEPGSSPYSHRIKPRSTKLKRRKDRRTFEVESPNISDDLNKNIASPEKLCTNRNKRRRNNAFENQFHRTLDSKYLHI
ncbi:LEM domain-containing protein [Caerostris darwini]|uniref:LEM domain-containing protein n=1 Tax=Caerostris darwini TaxID=1538125 RepID=A0AAV4MUS1_9ARAC|nr:LEM domain-containing protein [Caerostris darwini]